MLGPVAIAHADDADTQAARRHFERAALLYEQERYEEAIGEFQTAREIKPVPAFDYNIGKCFDRLERWKEAADAYERYLGAQPDAAGATELTARVALLRARQRAEAESPKKKPGESPTVVTTPPALIAGVPAARARPIYKRAWFWGAVVGGVAAVALGVGLGVGLSGGGDGSHAIADVRF